MALELRKAQRSKAFLRLGIASPSGGGKTLGSLLIAYGLMKEKYPNESDEFCWEKIAIVDTENKSGELYVGAEVESINLTIGEYNAITLTAPFKADKYINAIRLCEENGIEVCIIDSTTHLWSGEGGLLEQQGNISARSNNSWTAWREITPMHNRFVETMLQSNLHIIATMRSKQEYVQEKDEKTNKTSVKKLGMEPQQRKGMEYEFTTFFDISAEHQAYGSKDRTSMFDQEYFKITPDTGKKMMAWLQGGTANKPVVVATSTHQADSTQPIESLKVEVVQQCKDLGGQKNQKLMTLLKTYSDSGNPNSIKDATKLAELKAKLETMLVEQETTQD